MANSKRLQQIDVLKGGAAIAVVATHSMTVAQKTAWWTVLHVWQAVPVFVILLGANSALSFSRKDDRRLRSVLTRRYLISRAQRILLPFLVIWPLALAVGIYARRVVLNGLTLIGLLPYPGPGNYFVPLVAALVLLAPLVWWGWVRSPWLTLGTLFAIDLIFELAVTRVPLFVEAPFLYSAAVPRYLAALGLGFLIADSRIPRNTRYAFVFCGAVLSLAYLVAGNLGVWSAPFLPTWRTQNLLAVFYPAAIVVAGLLLLPSDGSGMAVRSLARAGRASYHVFLVQMVYFMVVPQGRVILLVVNVVLCVLGGIAFHESDSRLVSAVAARNSHH
jgi:peptidoglycan/LPS O-acetylase OafA/YrhL